MIYRIVNALGKKLEWRFIRFSDGTTNVEVLSDKMLFTESPVQSTFTITADASGHEGTMDTVIWDLNLLADAVRSFVPACTLNLYFTYLPNARADRRFLPTNANPLQVFVNCINKIGFNEVFVEVPHNAGALPAKWHVIEKEIVLNLLTRAEPTVIVFPDEGAELRFNYTLQTTKLPKRCITFAKTRDLATGQVTGVKQTSGPSAVKAVNETFVIIDDICDGGRTFVEVGKALKERYPGCKVKLAVVHGIFAKGLGVLEGIIDEIVVHRLIGGYVVQSDIDWFNTNPVKQEGN